MSSWVKKVFRSQAASSVLYLILGICLVALPEQSLKVICMIVGGILAVMGIVHVTVYIRNKEQGFLLDLISGVLQLVVGGFLLLHPQVIIKILPILLGGVVLVDSIWTFRVCLEMRRLNFVRWNVLLGITLVFIVLGIVMIINPFETAKMMIIFSGVVYIFNGLMDIFFLLFLKNKERILSKMADAMIVDTRYAEKAGDVMDAQVDENGKVIVDADAVEVVEEVDVDSRE